MGNEFSSSARPRSVGEAPPGVVIKKKGELIVVDTLLEEGLNDGDLPHLCLDKTLLMGSGHDTFGPKDLEDVLTSVRRTKRKLNKLSVMFNDTGGQGIGNFIAKDTSVREVTVLCEDLSDDSIQSLGEALETNKTVEKLLLGGKELQEGAATALESVLKSPFSALQQLTSFNCGFRDVGAELLASGLACNNTLQRLDLAYCDIGEDGAAAIACAVHLHPTLSHLNLKNNAVGARGSAALADALRGNFVVRELMLGTNCVGSSGAGALAGALSENTALVYLDLGSNSIGDDGGVAIAEGLVRNGSLRHLNLRRNAIGRETCERIRVGWNKRNAKKSMQLRQPWHDGLSLPF
ncbi:unnamed protein product [Ectocarpus sp. 4 AP-2014]